MTRLVFEKKGWKKDKSSMDFHTAKDLLFFRMDDRTHFSGTLATMLKEKSPGKKIGLIFERIFISQEELAEKYSMKPNSPWLSFYYLHHIRKLIGLHSSSVNSYLKHNKGTIESVELAQFRKEKENLLQNLLTNS